MHIHASITAFIRLTHFSLSLHLDCLMSLTLTIIFPSAILVNVVFHEYLIDLCLELIGWFVDTA